jgi:hypothetical protein
MSIQAPHVSRAVDTFATDLRRHGTLVLDVDARDACVLGGNLQALPDRSAQPDPSATDLLGGAGSFYSDTAWTISGTGWGGNIRDGRARIHGAAANLAPDLEAGGPYTVWENGEQPLAIDISDPDGDELDAQVNVENGKVYLSSLTDITITSGANDSASVTISGDKLAVKAALAAMTITPTPGYNGKTVVTIVLQDEVNPPVEFVVDVNVWTSEHNRRLAELGLGPTPDSSLGFYDMLQYANIFPI